MNRGWLFFPAIVVGLVGACSLPTVNVSTPKPIEIDINMRVDVYQHAKGEPDPNAKAADDVEARRRSRMAEIQTLKNSRLIGENHQALLTVRDQPPGEYGAYVRRTVEAENADRRELMQQMVAKEGKPLAEIQVSLADRWREVSFPGEWVEVQEHDGTWRWVQKAASDGDGTPAAQAEKPVPAVQPFVAPVPAPTHAP